MPGMFLVWSPAGYHYCWGILSALKASHIPEYLSGSGHRTIANQIINHVTPILLTNKDRPSPIMFKIPSIMLFPNSQAIMLLTSAHYAQLCSLADCWHHTQTQHWSKYFLVLVVDI